MPQAIKGCIDAHHVGANPGCAERCAGTRAYTPSARHDFMHDKIVVADDAVITGSYNLSHSATENAENILVIEDRELADRYSATIHRLAQRYKSG